MLVRIKGVVEDILMTEGRNKEDRPWQRKTYVIRDNTYDKEEYNRKVHVSEFGKLDPNKIDPEFIYRSNYIVGNEVDIACYLETTDSGFTHVDFGKPYDEIDKPKETTSNVVKPDAQPAPELTPVPPIANDTVLPFYV